MKYFVSLVFAFSLLSGHASFAQKTAGYYDGNQLYDLCRKEFSKSPSDGGICRGYILGVADILIPGNETCPPQNISALFI